MKPLLFLGTRTARTTRTAATAFRHELVVRFYLLRLQNLGDLLFGCSLELAHLFASIVRRTVGHQFARLLHLIRKNGTNQLCLVIREIDNFLHGSNLTVEHLLWISTATTGAATAFGGLRHHHSNEEEKESRQRCDSLHDSSLGHRGKDNVCFDIHFVKKE